MILHKRAGDHFNLFVQGGIAAIAANYSNYTFFIYVPVSWRGLIPNWTKQQLNRSDCLDSSLTCSRQVNFHNKKKFIKVLINQF